ncbi:MAG: hypothetical protein ACI85V_003326, partial [bacterium]
FGDDEPAGGLFVFFDAAHQDTVVEWGKQHSYAAFQDLQGRVACVETYWHSPHQSANKLEIVIVNGHYNGSDNYIFWFFSPQI